MKTRYFIVVIALVAAAAFVSGACSRTKTIKTDEGEVSLSEKGGVIKIKTKDGEAVATFGEGTKVPSNLSKDVPVYKPADVTTSQVLEDGDKIMLTLNTKDGSAKVEKFYKKELADNGWKVMNTMNMGPVKILRGVKGAQKLSVSINSSGGETNISLAYSGK